MKTIIVTGSVGSGKTTLAKKLSKFLGFKYIDVNDVVKRNKLAESYDKEMECNIVDVEKLNKFLIELIKFSKEELIIDSHMSHYLPKKYIDLCVVTKCEIDVLKKRLKKRKYSLQKIKDNIEAEIFNVCFEEAKENGHKILLVDTSKGITKENLSLIS
ncbi:AAA family ATPase [Candidatus Woesearchaeota archaeon]|nr:AAA family ATPase [Candidatus Woesearchaeota archaeon]